MGEDLALWGLAILVHALWLRETLIGLAELGCASPALKTWATVGAGALLDLAPLVVGLPAALSDLVTLRSLILMTWIALVGVPRERLAGLLSLAAAEAVGVLHRAILPPVSSASDLSWLLFVLTLCLAWTFGTSSLRRQAAADVPPPEGEPKVEQVAPAPPPPKVSVPPVEAPPPVAVVPPLEAVAQAPPSPPLTDAREEEEEESQAARYDTLDEDLLWRLSPTISLSQVREAIEAVGKRTRHRVEVNDAAFTLQPGSGGSFLSLRQKAALSSHVDEAISDPDVWKHLVTLAHFGLQKSCALRRLKLESLWETSRPEGGAPRMRRYVTDPDDRPPPSLLVTPDARTNPKGVVVLVHDSDAGLVGSAGVWARGVCGSLGMRQGSIQSLGRLHWGHWSDSKEEGGGLGLVVTDINSGGVDRDVDTLGAPRELPQSTELGQWKRGMLTPLEEAPDEGDDASTRTGGGTGLSGVLTTASSRSRTDASVLGSVPSAGEHPCLQHLLDTWDMFLRPTFESPSRALVWVAHGGGGVFLLRALGRRKDMAGATSFVLLLDPSKPTMDELGGMLLSGSSLCQSLVDGRLVVLERSSAPPQMPSRRLVRHRALHTSLSPHSFYTHMLGASDDVGVIRKVGDMVPGIIERRLAREVRPASSSMAAGAVSSPDESSVLGGEWGGEEA
jgi:hypothetical protein